jgi:hypothetical protein
MYKKLKFLFVIILMSNIAACTATESGCETETICFGDNNCVERPIPGTCF